MTDTQESTDHIRIVHELKKVQAALLDTGTRNRLVHVNRKNQRAKCLNIVNERCDHVFDILRKRSRTMRFRAVGPDGPVDDAIVLWTADDDGETARHTDEYLETPIGRDALEKRLLHLARDERTAEEEQGVNILYLALGFLVWYEDDSSSIERHAPLILLPAELVRDNRRSTYNIRCRAEDIDTNLPLQERLRQDFGITLPDIEEDEDRQRHGNCTVSGSGRLDARWDHGQALRRRLRHVRVQEHRIDAAFRWRTVETLRQPWQVGPLRRNPNVPRQGSGSCRRSPRAGRPQAHRPSGSSGGKN